MFRIRYVTLVPSEWGCKGVLALVPVRPVHPDERMIRICAYLDSSCEHVAAKKGQSPVVGDERPDHVEVHASNGGAFAQHGPISHRRNATYIRCRLVNTACSASIGPVTRSPIGR